MKNQTAKNLSAKYCPILFLFILTVLACLLFVCRHGMFASNIDWINQHSVFPDYFRRQFYETKQLFPEFAPNIGGGQNIYFFSYYGLYSPLILFSYLLPFVKMSDYLIAISIICLAASVMLLYYWLTMCGFSLDICLSCAVMFLLASPMIFQSYRQIMFVNYMPFLCLALIGAQQYWQSGKTRLYTLGLFFMIMTSFYFSIAGIAAVFLYGMSKSKKTPGRHCFFHFVLPIFSAVCASGILLVPTAHVLLSRNGSSRPAAIKDLLLPDFSLVRFACSGYGIGLTTGIFTVLFIGLFYKNQKERLLSAICLAVITIPFFSWIFNGCLYVRDKSLIPFLPLFCYLTAVYMDKQKQKELSFRVSSAAYMLTIFWCFLSWRLQKQAIRSQRYAFLLFESILLFVFFLIYWKRRRILLLILPSIACLCLFGIQLNKEDGAILKKEDYDCAVDISYQTEIAHILENDQALYRLEQTGNDTEKKNHINRVWNAKQWNTSVYSSAYQENYMQFRENVFHTEQPFRNKLMQSASDNPLFQKFMGVKYTLKRDCTNDTFQLEKQTHAAPIIYATNRLISKKQYEALPYPYCQTALMQYAVTNTTNTIDRKPLEQTFADGLWHIKQTDISILNVNGIQKQQNGYCVKTKKEISSWIHVKGSKKDCKKERLFFIQFQVKNNNKNQDVAIDLNGTRNKLSAQNHIYYNGNTAFSYTLRLKAGETAVKLLLGKGNYRITNIKCFVTDAAILDETSLYQSPFLPDWTKTKGNCISGRIQAQNSGYLITSIPFDKGFTILIDGKEAPLLKVNTAFVGTTISKGSHNIDLIYHAPGLWIGKILTCIGLGLIVSNVSLIIFDERI